MRFFILLLIVLLSHSFVFAQSLIGAWERYSTSESGEKVRNVLIFSEEFKVSSWFHAKTGAFIRTSGGSWQLDDGTLVETIEFDSENPDRVGTKEFYRLDINKFKIDINNTIVGKPDKFTFDLLDKEDSFKILQGAWLMSGRVRNGEMRSRDTNRPRKTMKILSGTRFQWIAYNTETKQFMGTGGGTYTAVDGKYTENIEFFSRDDSRVGASLEFDFDLKEGKWHHKGFSSKGDPMHEVWSRRD